MGTFIKQSQGWMLLLVSRLLGSERRSIASYRIMLPRARGLFIYSPGLIPLFLGHRGLGAGALCIYIDIQASISACFFQIWLGLVQSKYAIKSSIFKK